MGVTVEKFLEIVSDYKLKTVCGEAGMGNATEWFHFVEDEHEILYLNEKELVFSTMAGMLEETAFMDFVKRLTNKQSSGLVIFVDDMQELPCSVMDYCDEKHFPVIKAPADTNVSGITKLFCLQILESEKANKQLFSAMKNAISFPQKTELYMPTFLQYGFRKNEPYTTVIIEIQQIQQLSVAEVQWIVKSIEQTLLSAGDKSFVLNMEGIFVLVFSNYTSQAIREIVLKIIVMLRMKEYIFFTGVSSNLTGLENLSTSYIQAKQIIDLATKKEWMNMLVHYDELGVYQLLMSISDKAVKQQYYESVLGELEQYDRNNKSNYQEFLFTFLSCNCNINETADKLFVHRNTVVYKINKIEELLDVDLSDIEVKVQLYLAKLLKETL